MPLDPQAEQILLNTVGPDFSELKSMPLELSRKYHMDSVIQAERGLEPVAQIDNQFIPGPYGTIPIRIYTPQGTGNFPVLVWFHGGGWVWGNLETAEEACRALANKSGCVVVSVDYRLAPEHPFPIPVEEAYASVEWVAEHAAEMNVDPSQISVGGDSAGGNLAAAVSLLARDRKGPFISYQLLVYPVTDCSLSTESYELFKEGYSLTKEKMNWFWEQYLSKAEEFQNPYAAPLLAEDLVGLPPAFVITAEYDPLRDEGEAYSKRLKEAGVPVKYSCSPGMIHGFFTRVAQFHKAKLAIMEAAKALQEAFA